MTPMLTIGRTMPVLPRARVRSGLSGAEATGTVAGAAAARSAEGLSAQLKKVTAPDTLSVFVRKSLRLSVLCDGVMSGSFSEIAGSPPGASSVQGIVPNLVQDAN